MPKPRFTLRLDDETYLGIIDLDPSSSIQDTIRRLIRRALDDRAADYQRALLTRLAATFRSATFMVRATAPHRCVARVVQVDCLNHGDQPKALDTWRRLVDVRARDLGDGYAAVELVGARDTPRAGVRLTVATVPLTGSTRIGIRLSQQGPRIALSELAAGDASIKAGLR